jgi:hypothetical protein
MVRDCPSICQNTVDFGACMAGCQSDEPCSKLCSPDEWDRDTCVSECRVKGATTEMSSVNKKKRTRADIPWSYKIKHHLYFIPLAAAIVFGFAAWKASKITH